MLSEAIPSAAQGLWWDSGVLPVQHLVDDDDLAGATAAAVDRQQGLGPHLAVDPHQHAQEDVTRSLMFSTMRRP